MINNKWDQAKDGLKLIERQHGRLRLDIEDHYSSRDNEVLADSWSINQNIINEWFDNEPDAYEKYKELMHSVHLSMFDDQWTNLSITCAQKIMGNEWNNVSRIPVANTSIPILNAAAVCFNDSTYGIFLNSRIQSQLTPVNSLRANIEFKYHNSDSIKKPAKPVNTYKQYIVEILTNTTDNLFDLISKCQPYESAFFHWFGTRHTLLQHIFILLHEYAHVLKGHLQRKDVWLGHPLSTQEYSFFNDDQIMEIEADDLALKFLLDPTNREQLPEPWNMPDGNPNFIPNAIVLLFIWFSIMIGKDVEGYYKISRSHPHPLDRIKSIIRIVEHFHSHYNVDKFHFMVEKQKKFFLNDSL